MKQKMVIKVSVNSQKSRSKALKIAVGFSGVESVAFEGQDKNQLAVTGDGVDVIKLTRLLRKGLATRICLRKRIGYAELVSVNPVGGGGGGAKKDEKKDDKKSDGKVQPVNWSPYGGTYIYEVRDREPYYCSIL